MLGPIFGISKGINLCVCVFPGGVYSEGWGADGAAQWVYVRRECLCLEVTTSTCYGMFVLRMFSCISERAIQGVHSPPRGLQSSWLGLCQAIWGAPMLYGARVKNGNANK